MFACTGVTSGPMLRGVKRFGDGAITHSVVMRSNSGTVRYVEAHHNFQTEDLGGEEGAVDAVTRCGPHGRSELCLVIIAFMRHYEAACSASSAV